MMPIKRTYWVSSGLIFSCRIVLRASSRNCICARACAQCVGGGRHRRNCRVTGVLGGLACFFGGAPKRFPLLSDRFDLLPRALSDFPDFLGQRTDVFSRRAGQFRAGAILFDAAAGLLAFFSLAFRHFACTFSFDATLLGRSIGHLSLPTI